NSPVETGVPFIFQLPATIGRRASPAMSDFPPFPESNQAVAERLRARPSQPCDHLPLPTSEIPRMTPKLTQTLFRPFCKTDARCGWLPAARAARMMVEELIWPFSLASGSIPPVDCS